MALLLRVVAFVAPVLVLVEVGVGVDELHVFCPPVGVRFQRREAPHRVGVGVHPALRRHPHVRQVDECRHVAAVAPVLVGRLGQPEREVERQVGAPLRAQHQRRGPVARRRRAAQEDRHRHHAVRLEHLRQVQAIVRQPVRREPPRLGLLLDHEQHGLAPAVVPLDLQRHVELAEAVAEALLELLLAQRLDAHAVPRFRRLLGGEEGKGVAGIVEDEVLEVLVVADVRHGSRPVSGSPKMVA
ncbi:MAG: hypothetical protein OXI55_00020 [Gammaproteobacteria bacterium]|nr:hypothetical protein [Gammaproteobacteria bacterium]